MLVAMLALYGCYPGGGSTADDYTLVKTQYNQAYDFEGQKTFYLPDSILFYTNIDDDDVDWEKVEEYEEIMLREIQKQMEAKGYVLEKTDTTNMDLVVLPSAVLSKSSGATWWPGGGWWGGYYPPGWGWGGGWYYPPGYGGYWSYYSYTTGTAFITIADFDSYEESEEESIEIEWDAAIDGLLQGVNATKIDKLIQQAFDQSPYLVSNVE